MPAAISSRTSSRRTSSPRSGPWQPATCPLSPTVLRRVVAAYVDGGRRPHDERLERLSEREREVLVLLGQGLTNAEICDRLVVSMPTTKTHVANVLAKLDVRDRVQAAIFAHRNGLV